MYNTKILVTGGAGFIGSHLVDRLVAEGYPVIVVDNLYAGRSEQINPKVLRREDLCRFYQMDIRDPELHRVFEMERPDYVIHLAGQMDPRLSVLDPLLDSDVNIVGSLNVLKNCVRFKVKKILFASSGGSIYGELPAHEHASLISHPAAPVSPYGYSKLSFEVQLRFAQEAYWLDFVALRLANIYGPRQESSRECGVISLFTKQFLSGQQPIINGDGEQTRDLVYVDDCVDAFIRAMRVGAHGIYNVGTATRTSVNDLFDMLVSATGINMEKKYGPAKKGDVMHSCIDYSETKSRLGWSPKTSLSEGIATMIAVMRDPAVKKAREENRLLFDSLGPEKRFGHWLLNG